MSAAEEDTELRDLLIHTLENNGVLNKIKAELRASVFLALEEQERAEEKSPLLNEGLRRFLDTTEGRLVAGLVTDFLRHFHLDFTLAVFQPEANLPVTPDDRADLARELGLPEAERGAPLLLELVRHREVVGGRPQEVSSGHIAEAKAKFHLYDRDKSGEISKDELRELFVDLFPHFHRNMLDRYVNDEFSAADRDFSSGINLQEFLGMYQRLFVQCKSVVAQDVSDLLHSPTKLQLDVKSKSDSLTDKSSSSSRKGHDQLHSGNVLKPQAKLDDLGFEENEDLRLDEHDLEGDSFFDDPIPKPQKTYGWRAERSKSNGSLSGFMNSTQKLEYSSRPEASNISDDSHHLSLKDLKSASDKMASLELGAGNEDDYADDFNSTSQRSDKSEVSIGEDLDEELSVDDLTGSDNKLEDFTLDNSISHISDVADYMEDIS